MAASVYSTKCFFRATSSSRPSVPGRTAWHRHRSHLLLGSRRKPFTCRASEDNDKATGERPESTSDSDTNISTIKRDGTDQQKKVPVSAADASARRTAIWTGAVSLVFGVGYLILVQLLGDRELLPPPPEALGL